MKKRICILVCLICSLLLFVGCQQKEEDIKKAADWKDEYPDIYASYLTNSQMQRTSYGGSEPYDYLTEYPSLKTFYAGYGFSEDYLRARGHIYALEDVIGTVRPKGGASCLTCKTATFTEALNKDGVEMNAANFDQFLADHPEAEGVSCYDCHRNTPGQVQITRAHLSDALTDDNKEIDSANLACAQCHVEYYLDPETKEVILPWEDGMTTDDMLDYYDEINFADWKHPSTGAGMLKAQHPEFETYYESGHYNAGLSCIDCHMPNVEGESGESFKSHQWTSPLLSEDTLKQSCLSCHSGEVDQLVSNVENVQKAVYNKTQEVSDELLDYVNRLSQAIEENAIEGEDLEKLQEIHREAQFKWDFVFVENGEGFHNSRKAHKNLNEARALVEEGVAILQKYNR